MLPDVEITDKLPNLHRLRLRLVCFDCSGSVNRCVTLSLTHPKIAVNCQLSTVNYSIAIIIDMSMNRQIVIDLIESIGYCLAPL